MLKKIAGTISHAVNLTKHALRDVGTFHKRSSHWPTVRNKFIEGHDSCAACGSKERLNVHHCMPFHLDPSLELDPNNLITLCMSPKECHFHIAHGGSFRKYCPDVRTYATEALSNPEKFDEIVNTAKNNTKS